jgi:KUP system potassium uptake protein
LVFGGAELTYLGANLTKVVHGGWLPLVVAALVVTVMTTWQRGRRIVTERREQVEGSLTGFVQQLHDHPVRRVPGTAVFPHPTKLTAPLALRANVQHNHILHEHVVLVSVQSEPVPRVPVEDRIEVDDLGYGDDGIVHITARFGFQDDQDLPAVLRQARGRTAELDIDPERASYFLSRITVERGRQRGLAGWRKRLFIGLAHNAASPAAYFGLPTDRTVVMGSRIEL